MHYIPFSRYSFTFLACQLIALNKFPGVWPIRVCEVVRRIVTKAALYIIRDDIQGGAGSH